MTCHAKVKVKARKPIRARSRVVLSHLIHYDIF